VAGTLLHVYVAAFAIAMTCISLLAQPTKAGERGDDLPVWLAWCSLLLAVAAAAHALHGLARASGLAANALGPEQREVMGSDSGLQMLTSNPIQEDPGKRPSRQELEA
jgi:hypothetical protein